MEVFSPAIVAAAFALIRATVIGVVDSPFYWDG
jgi:hypothetical protein